MTEHAFQQRARARAWALGVGVLLALSALAWITAAALRIERQELVARSRGEAQERLRLALWRIDSAITPIIAREAARPYFEYQPFYSAGAAYTKRLEPVEPGEVLVPSSLLALEDPLINIHYQRLPDGRVESPQAPAGDLRVAADGSYLTPYQMESNERLLTQLESILGTGRSLASPLGFGGADAAAAAGSSSIDGHAAPAESGDDAHADLQTGALADERRDGSPPAPMQTQQAESLPAANDYSARKAVAQQAQRSQKREEPPEEGRGRAAGDRARGPQAPDPGPAATNTELRETKERVQRTPAAASGPDYAASEPLAASRLFAADTVSQSEFVPRWVGEGPELVFARTVRVGGQEIEQGFWVDWAALRDQLVSQVSDIMPGAALTPVRDDPQALPPAVLGRMLATIPASLEEPERPLSGADAWSPLKSALLATWVLVLGAITALIATARSSAELAERRGRFVSAVTHELRTPLTTFRLYSQMLAEGMVNDEETRRTYFKTLASEADRLSGIVESVLEYARMGRAERPTLERLSVGALADRIGPRVGALAAVCGMALAEERPDDDASRREIATDATKVERIVTNLVDNACKYAHDAADKGVAVAWRVSGDRLRVVVRDFGPGVPRADAQRIFRPFMRGDSHADGSIPGLGLGLAMARGLAEQLGGSLELTGHTAGAEFTLELPLGTT